MLSLTSMGYPVIERYAPLGRGLGDYTETKTSSGSCAGSDFRCSTRPEDGNTFSCRPCTFEALEVFKRLQAQLNRLVAVKGLGSGYILDADGRIGAKTVRTARAVSKAGSIPAGVEAGSRYLAVHAEDIVKELEASAGSGKTDIPVGPTAPSSSAPGPATPPVTVARKSRAGVVVGALATVTALGLVGAAAYAKRKK